jgi:hypothetical protein
VIIDKTKKLAPERKLRQSGDEDGTKRLQMLRPISGHGNPSPRTLRVSGLRAIGTGSNP